MWEINWWEVLGWLLFGFMVLLVGGYISLVWVMIASKAITHGVVSELYRLEKLHKETGNGDKV